MSSLHGDIGWTRPPPAPLRADRCPEDRFALKSIRRPRRSRETLTSGVAALAVAWAGFSRARRRQVSVNTF